MKSALRKNPQMSYTMSSTRRPTSHSKIHMLPLYFMYICKSLQTMKYLIDFQVAIKGIKVLGAFLSFQNHVTNSKSCCFKEIPPLSPRLCINC